VSPLSLTVLVLATAAIPILAVALYRWILEARVKRRSEQTRLLATQILSLTQIKHHWETLENELRPLDAAGRTAWLNRLRSSDGADSTELTRI
jgi:hypothetical protein